MRKWSGSVAHGDQFIPGMEYQDESDNIHNASCIKTSVSTQNDFHKSMNLEDQQHPHGNVISNDQI